MEIQCPVCDSYVYDNNIGFSGGICWCKNCGSELQVYFEVDVHVVEERHDHLQEGDEQDW